MPLVIEFTSSRVKREYLTKGLFIMKRFLAVVALAVAGAPAFATGTSVSVAVGQPGFYGHIDISNFPQPHLLYPEPLIIQSGPVGVVRRPVYLYVPSEHAKDWHKHCKKYNACGEPVYFVQEKWYKEVYVPAYRDRKGHAKEDKKKEGKGKVQKQE